MIFNSCVLLLTNEFQLFAVSQFTLHQNLNMFKYTVTQQNQMLI